MKSQCVLVEESMVWAVGRYLEAIRQDDIDEVIAALDLLQMKYDAATADYSVCK